MRKVFLLVFLLALFSGCARNNSEIVDFGEKIAYHIGKVTSLGSVKQKDGVGYLLTKDDGKTILVKSSKVNLASEKYIGQLVEIAGVEFMTEDGKLALEVKSIDLIEKELKNANKKALIEEKSLINDFFGLRFSVWENTKTFIEGENLVIYGNGFKVLLKPLDYADVEEFFSKNLEKKLAKGINPEGLSMLKFIDNENIPRFYFDSKNGVIEFKLEFIENIENKNEVLNKFIEFVNGVKSEFVKKSKDEIKNQAEDVGDVMKINLDGDEVLENVSGINSGDVVLLSEGFEIFSSDGFNFKIAYPKNLFFESTSNSDPSVMRSYIFGFKEDEKISDVLTLDLMKTKLPNGSVLDYGKNKVVRVSDGDNLILYVQQGELGRVYRLKGKFKDEKILIEMAKSLAEVKE